MPMAEPRFSSAAIPGDPAGDWHWLSAAIDLSRRCPPSESAFSVGAVLVTGAGEVVATGYSRETDPKDHAEEVAMRRAETAWRESPIEVGATLYSSLEPCLARVSRPVSCARLIASSGIRRVVIAWREPPVFQPGGGSAWLAAHGVTVVELPELAAAARDVNRHLLAS